MKAVVKLVQINRTAPGKCKANLRQEPKAQLVLFAIALLKLIILSHYFYIGKLSIGMTQYGIWKTFVCVSFYQGEVCYLHIFSQHVAQLEALDLVEMIES